MGKILFRRYCKRRVGFLLFSDGCWTLDCYWWSVEHQSKDHC